jgi:hypothetical protein
MKIIAIGFYEELQVKIKELDGKGRSYCLNHTDLGIYELWA